MLLKQRKWLNPQIGPVSICIILLLLHALLKGIVVRFDIVSIILAAGSNTSPWMLICAGGFLVIRIAVFILVPAILIWRITIEIGYRIKYGRSCRLSGA